MKKLTIGILAHVDAGKTTLSEGLLYLSGAIRSLGKVDTKNAFLDTDAMERQRGITIYSKQARLKAGDLELVLLDTPGHVDFSPEMERVLGVLDYAILLVSGADGVQGHTHTLWQLLKKHQVPVFLFVNKMDQQGTDRVRLMTEIRERLDVSCVDFSDLTSYEIREEIASCSEETMEAFFETEQVDHEAVCAMIRRRELYPVYFGSALKLMGIREFLEGFTQHVTVPTYPEAFGARVFKITRDDQGNRETHVKLTGGSVKVREVLTGRNPETDENWEEKVTQIRLYSGENFEAVPEADAGDVCVLMGLTQTYPGQGLGFEKDGLTPTLEPVLVRKLILPEGVRAPQIMPRLRELTEEQPELHIVWDEELRELQAQIMGEVQVEILKDLLKTRLGLDVEFGPANIVYKETIADTVEGVGHFEPLRHYAEVHLLLEPLPAGTGMQFGTSVSEDVLDKNWQRLIMTHLEERIHKGVLTGAALTDVRITVIAGRAHQKHTEGGDFRQATYRAVRQGLMEAESVLLEPYFNFRLEIPESMVGRAMMDIEQMQGHVEPPYFEGEEAILTGYAPVVTMQEYQKEVMTYTKGFGRISYALRGYEPCHNAEEVILNKGYDPESDLRNTPDSVFCAHGAGFVVPWYEVKQMMHVESPLAEQKTVEIPVRRSGGGSVEDTWMGTEEVDAIIEQTYHTNRRDKNVPRKGVVRRRKKEEYIAPVSKSFTPKPKRERYLLVDGYNIIHAWQELKELMQINMDSARDRLLDILCDYQGSQGMELIVVFDAYRVAGHKTEYFDYHNIHVVFTQEAETADQYIERFAHEHSAKYDVTVATSDGLEQIIIRGEGCRLLSARDFEEEVRLVKDRLKEQYMKESVKNLSNTVLKK